MAKTEDKEIRKIFDVIDEITPYACYLDQSIYSNIDEYIDTGSLALNAIISGSMYGGVPVGRVTQFAGPSMSGKTFFIQKLIASAQKMGKHVVIFDSENAIDANGALGFGIDPTKVKYVATTTIENTKHAIKRFLKKVAETKRLGEFVIIVDSLAQMESELNEKRMDDDNAAADMGTFAKAIKSFLKTCINWGKVTKTTVIITNEVYENPGQMYPSLDKNMPGGHAAVYKPTVTVQLARKPMKDDDGKTVDNTLAAGQKKFSGIVLRCLTVKNRLIKQFLEVELYLSFATGLDKYYGLLDLMKGLGVVVSDGARYKDYEGNSLGFYKSWRKYEDNKELWDRLLSVLEPRLLPAWEYSGDEVPDEELDGEDDIDLDEEDEIQEIKKLTALDSLKNLKKQVSVKIDKIEEEEVPLEED